ncbi:unnamed protein product [Candidula unifasciata]|uniref:MSP domain-containing protein n=1 Tax=Candidula unifasciata TaxID=100452 RepID=A0A8S3YFR3_9EUPU|nr:unnamed protein product [Candidula unifasciata]
MMTSESLASQASNMKSDAKVHFHEAEEHSSNSPSPAASPSGSDTESPPRHKTLASLLRRSHSHNGHTRHDMSNNAADKRVRSDSSGSSSTFVGPLLTVSPADELVFESGDSADPFDIITLTNTMPYPVAFKVKTTAPEKFRVRPSSGLIKPQKTEEVHVYLISEPTENINKEKFLIMAVNTKGDCVDTNQLFRDSPKELIMQHKLRCSCAAQIHSLEKNINSSTDVAAVQQQRLVEQIEAQTRHIHRQLKLLLLIQFLTAFFLLLFVLSYSCFGEDVFTRFLALPFDFCHTSHGRRCT